MIKKNVFRPHLVQSFLSLKAEKVHNSFGGGGPYGGLSKKAFGEINKICRIPSMGAAEFEGRYLPDALQSMKEYVTKGSLSIKTITIGKPKDPKHKLIVLAHDDYIDACCEVITSWAHQLTFDEWLNFGKGKKDRPTSTKGHDLFHVAITAKEKDDPQLPVGWICEDHVPYMFFLSEDMAKDFIKLFYSDIDFHRKG